MDNVEPCIPHVARKCAKTGQLAEQQRHHVCLQPQNHLLPSMQQLHRSLAHCIGRHPLFKKQ